jgi:hypothetical protein
VRSLVELERALVTAVGHQSFAPGLDDDRIEELLRPSGLSLPDEVRDYFRARDGVRPPTRVQAPWLIGHWLPLPLDQALRERDARREMALEEFQADPDSLDDDVWAPAGSRSSARGTATSSRWTAPHRRTPTPARGCSACLA